MRWTREYSKVRIAVPEAKVDDQGGLIPTDEERAKHVDLITLPEGVTGTNCGNCLFIREIEGRRQKHCIHPEVDMPVNNRMCCKYWDAYGTGRHFKFDREEEILSGSAIETEVGTTSH
jgi:hypothetical protein